MSNSKIALIAGSTGLVGGFLLNYLLNNSNYSKVIALVRKKQNTIHQKLEQIVFDFENQESYSQLPKVHSIYCTLGTTIKKAGGKDNFIKVDYAYPLALAKFGKEFGTEKFSIVTTMGADASSLVFYNKVKGEVEADIQKLNYPILHVFRPSLLLGNRAEIRVGEKVGEVFMQIFNPFLAGNLKKYRSIKADDVAKAMNVAENKGIHIYLSDEIQKMADSSNL